MTKGFPLWFRLLFVGAMLAVCVVMVTQIIHQHSAVEELAVLQGKIESTQGRIPRQVRERDEARDALPDVLAELAEAQPLADEQTARVNELKASRNALRKEIEAQRALIAELEAALAELPDVSGNRQTLTTTYEQLNETLSEIQE